MGSLKSIYNLKEFNILRIKEDIREKKSNDCIIFGRLPSLTTTN